MRLRDFAWALLCLLVSISVSAQQLRDARMLAAEVDVSQEATLLLSLDKNSASVWCGLRVDFGNGRDQNLRVGERGDADLQMQVRYRYPTPGLYTVRVFGASLTRGLRSVVACEGGERSFQVRVSDRGAAPALATAPMPAALPENLPPRGAPVPPAWVQPPSPGPVYTPMPGTAQSESLSPSAMPAAPTVYPTAPADPGIYSPGPSPYPAAQSASPMPPPPNSPSYGYAGAAPGAAGGQLMHDCGPKPDAACIARTVAEAVVKLRDAFGKNKAGASNTGSMPYASGGYMTPPPPAPPVPMGADVPAYPTARLPETGSPPPAGFPTVPSAGSPALASPAAPAAQLVAQAGAAPQGPAPPGATLPWPAIPRGARTPIEGAFYVQRTYMTMGGGISLNHESYFFTSNGRFSNSPSGGVNLAALAAQPAASRYEGSYWIEGQELVMAWADGSKPWRSKFEGDARSIVIGSSFASRQTPFPRGWRLDGSYEGGASIGGGTSSSSTIRFRRDGTFTRGSSVAIVSSTSRSDVTAGGSAAGGGTYEFDGFMLTLRENGAERKFTVFAYGERDASGRPEHIFNQGLMMKRQ